MRRWLLAALLAIAACSPVPTDGPDAQGYSWRKDGVAVPPANWRHHVVKDIYLVCNQELKAQSCAKVQMDGSACDIYLPVGYESWRREHEERHCDGWTHPNSLKGNQI